jgi:predicted GH43/DUF377 family glycosyl hydrolase
MDLFRRHENNPILTVNDLPVHAIAVYNPGVAEMNGEVILLLRVELADGRSSLYVARSKDGVNNWEVSPTPLLAPDDPDNPIAEYETIGCEDPRLTYIAELDEWLIAYVAVSDAGPAVALARTKDFKSAERIGIVLAPPNKDAAVFPRRINGRWFMLHRPMSWGTEHIWLAESPDLIHWGNPRLCSESVAELGGTALGSGQVMSPLRRLKVGLSSITALRKSLEHQVTGSVWHFWIWMTRQNSLPAADTLSSAPMPTTNGSVTVSTSSSHVGH